MIRGWLCAFIAMLVLAGSLPTDLRADPLYHEFLLKLREQRDYELAEQYLNELEANERTPAEIRAAVSFERAVLQLDQARNTQSAAKKRELLDKAVGFLEQFTTDHPSHPLAGDADSERASILLEQSRLEIQQARLPVNAGDQAEMQERARELVNAARRVYQSAYDRHQADFKQFEGFIDPLKDQSRYERKQQVERLLIEAAVKLGMAEFYEAETYNPRSAEAARVYGEAAKKFEQLAGQYRGSVAGLECRLWQGKCYQEQGEYQQALGIFNDVLQNTKEDEASRMLLRQAAFFKFACMNAKEPPESAVVADDAEEWLKKNPQRDEFTVGVRLELAKALKSLGDKGDAPAPDKQRYWRQARQEATKVAELKGYIQYAPYAADLVRQLDQSLGGPAKVKLEKFEDAFNRANDLFERLTEQRKDLAIAQKANKPADELKKLQTEIDLTVQDLAPVLEYGIATSDRAPEPKYVLTMWQYAAYVNLWRKRYYECAVLADYIARRPFKDQEDESIGIDAAFLAMAALNFAYAENREPYERKQEDLQLVVRAATLLVTKWPRSERAQEARLALGKLFSVAHDPVRAAQWLSEIPESDAKFAEAQTQGGQAFWYAYLTSNRLPEAERPSAAQLDEWRNRAEQMLGTAINKLKPSLSKDREPPDAYYDARITLAEILLRKGRDADAIKALLEEPNSIIAAIKVPDESQRPERGIKKRSVATQCYKMLLRGYIAVGDLEAARDTMDQLELVVGGGGGGDVTELYVSVGRQLRDELERLKAAGDLDRYEQLSAAFQRLLDNLSERKDQSFGSLSWIGETYFVLGEAAQGDPGRAAQSFDKAAEAFQRIINTIQARPDFAPQGRIMGVKLRLVRCQREKQDFPQALAILGDILREHPDDLKAQIEAAQLYQAWGMSTASSDRVKQLSVAIQGDPAAKVQGWGKVSQRLQRAMETRPELSEPFLDARINWALCLQRLALEQPSAAKKAQALDRTLQSLKATALAVAELPEGRYQQLNQLYRQVLQDQNKPPSDLPVTKGFEMPAPDAVGRDEQAEQQKKQKAEPLPPPPPESSVGVILTGVGVFVAVGIGIVGWIMFAGRKKKRRKLPGDPPESAPKLSPKLLAVAADDDGPPDFSAIAATMPVYKTGKPRFPGASGEGRSSSSRSKSGEAEATSSGKRSAMSSSSSPRSGSSSRSSSTGSSTSSSTGKSPTRVPRPPAAPGSAEAPPAAKPKPKPKPKPPTE